MAVDTHLTWLLHELKICYGRERKSHILFFKSIASTSKDE